MSTGTARRDEQWHRRSACRGSSAGLFFPPEVAEPAAARLEREEAARVVCQSCTVREPCLAYALRIREPHGIWGGLDEVERRALLPAPGRHARQ